MARQALKKDQGHLGMPGVYAYSVDDAVGNLNVYATGYIVDVGGTKNLENNKPAAPPINISFGYGPNDAGEVCDLWRLRQRPNPAEARQPRQRPVHHQRKRIRAIARSTSPTTSSRAQVYTFTVTTPPPFTVIPTADINKIPSLSVWSNGGGNPTKYNTASVINCSGNSGAAPSQSSKAWCCTLLPGSGSGVFAYSTPEVPPTAHQTMIFHDVVTNSATSPSSTSSLPTCNMGR